MNGDWERIIGLDLTDPFSRARRAIAVAEIRREDSESQPTIRIREPVVWPPLAEHCTAEIAEEILEQSGVTADTKALLVVDGPQALAQLGSSRRQCERLTAAPSRTPDHIPAVGPPFAGYIRGSVQFFDALLSDKRWRLLMTSEDRDATLLEAFPGDAWKRLSTGRLAAKATLLGRQQRLDLLEARFEVVRLRPLSHDDLDAAMCAAIGYWWMHGGAEILGNSPTFRVGRWREGYIVAPGASIGAQQASNMKPARPRRPPKADGRPEIDDAPKTWGYRATGTIANRSDTFELAREDNVLIRTVFNAGNAAIPNVKKIRPGDRIFLAHFQKGQRDWLQAIVDTPSPNLPRIRGYEEDFPAFGVIEEPDLVTHAVRLGYPPDPRLSVYTALLLTDVQHCESPPTKVVPGRNAIWRVKEDERVHDF